MVRRWSYINSLNSTYKHSLDGKRQSTFTVTVKSTMYFRKPYSVPTVLSRRRWARRKHLYGWLPMSNIIKSWAQTYRFVRNYLKSVMRSNMFKSSFIAFNLVSLKNMAPSSYKGLETILISSVSRKTLRYFSTKVSSRMNSLLHFKNANIAFMSFPDILPRVNKYTENNFVVPMLVDSVNFQSDLGYLPSFQSPDRAPQILTILTLTVLNSLKFIKYIYRINITLTLLRLSRNN
jgi:hypothetical protein